MAKKSFPLRMDAEALAAIEAWAAADFRSTNGQIEYLLAEALKKARRYPRKAAGGGAPQPQETECHE